METIREQLDKPWVTAAVGFVVGVIIGLVLLGWWLFPVKWIDATPAMLRADLRQDYLRMAIDSYSKNPDTKLALTRWEDLGDEAPAVLEEIQVDPGSLKPEEILAFQAVVVTVASAPPTSVTLSPTETVAAPVSSTTDGTQKPNTVVIFGVLCVLTLGIGGSLAYIFLVRNRQHGYAAVTASPAPGNTGKAISRPEYAKVDQDAPVAQFMTTYMAGDDLYDDSFSIDSASGEFLGECGVGISDTIGVGDPKKVTAFEVWLFDKNDIQTVTKVLMSAHAFNDPTIRQKLESKGEPVNTEAGKRILLETATLQLEARVVDMNYGQGALPTNSFFERLTLELAVWPKA